VTIKIGPAGKIFRVHSSFLAETSTFFKAAIEGNFKEAVDQQITMSEECEETFERFVRWLYSVGYREEEIMRIRGESELAARFKEIIDLFVFADKIGCLALEHDMVRDFYFLLDDYLGIFPLESVNYLYGVPVGAELLREMTVPYFVWEVNTSFYTTSENLQSLLARLPEFTKAVLIEMSARYGEMDAENPFFEGVTFYLDKHSEKHRNTDGLKSGGN
jgi:BTB/POZ domain